MKTLIHPASFEQEIKKSRFLAHAAPIASEDDARSFLATNSDRTANHNCWAYRIGQIYRFNDDGEPSGTAGKPILQAIDGHDLDGIAVVVTRWFGGVLLGAGGLIRAYGGTAALCLKSAETCEIVPKVTLRVSCPFSDLALIKARLVAISGLSILAEDYGAAGAELSIDLPIAEADRVRDMIVNLTSARAVVSAVD